MGRNAAGVLVSLMLLAGLAGCGGAPAAPAPSASASKPSPASTTPPPHPTPASPAASQPTSLQSLSLGEASVNLGDLPLWVAVQHGFFKQYGLDVHLVQMRGGTVAMAAMGSGKLPLSQAAGPTVIKPIMKGIPIKLIAGFVDVMAYDFLVSPSITSPSQLVGSKGAISGFGSADYYVQRWALRKLGVDPNKVKWLQVGNETNRLAALKAGQIQFTVLSAGLDTPAIQAGYKPLLKLYQSKQPYQATALAVNTQWASAHNGELMDLLKGLVAAEAYLRNPANETAVLDMAQAHLHVSASTLRSAFELYRGAIYQLYPKVSKAGMQFSLDAEHVKAPASRFYTNSYVDQLQREGFAAHLAG